MQLVQTSEYSIFHFQKSTPLILKYVWIASMKMLTSNDPDLYSYFFLMLSERGIIFPFFDVYIAIKSIEEDAIRTNDCQNCVKCLVFAKP